MFKDRRPRDHYEQVRLQAVKELKAKQTEMQSEVKEHPTPLGATYKVSVIDTAVLSDTVAYGLMIEASSRGLNAVLPGDFDLLKILSNGCLVTDSNKTKSNQSIFQGSAALDYLEEKWAFLKACHTTWAEIEKLLRVEQFEERKRRFEEILSASKFSSSHITDFGGVKVRGIGAGAHVLYEHGVLCSIDPILGEQKIPADQAKQIALDIPAFANNLYIRQFIIDFVGM